MEYFLLNLLPLISGIVLTISYVPQIITTYRTKDVTGIDKRFWILISIALSGLAVSTGAVWYYTGSFGNFITESANAILAIIMLVLVFMYRKRMIKNKGEDE